MGQKQLAFILPTSNRPASIAYYLDKQMSAFEERNVDVFIFDSSDTDETKKIVTKFQQEGRKHLFYNFYPEEEVDKRAIDRKVYTACSLYGKQYKYLWFSSDSTVFDISSLWEELFAAIQKNVDYIVLNHIQAQAKPCVEKWFCDSRPLLLEYSWVMTMLGANIISTRYVCEVVEKFPVISGEDFWFWWPMSIFHLFAEEKINAVVLANPSPYIMNPAHSDPFWKKRGDTIWQWAKIWPETVDALPTYYDEIKERVINAQEKNMHMFTVKNLLSMKASGQIRFDDIKKYHTHLARVTETPIWCFYLIAVLGNRRFLAWTKKVYKWVKFWRGER